MINVKRRTVNGARWAPKLVDRDETSQRESLAKDEGKPVSKQGKQAQREVPLGRIIAVAGGCDHIKFAGAWAFESGTGGSA
jgi:hypothetical protein